MILFNNNYYIFFQRWGFSKFVESYLTWNLPLKKYNMVPKHSFLQDVSSCKSLLLPDNFYGKVEEGSIVLKKIQYFSFIKQGLILDGEVDKPIIADLVIFATGYKGQEKLKNMFSSKKFQNHIMGSPNSIVPLYRYTLLLLLLLLHVCLLASHTQVLSESCAIRSRRAHTLLKRKKV